MAPADVVWCPKWPPKWPAWQVDSLAGGLSSDSESALLSRSEKSGRNTLIVLYESVDGSDMDSDPDSSTYSAKSPPISRPSRTTGPR